jgi:hypothetical protein
MIEFLKTHVVELLTFIGGISAWGYERNKRKLEIKKSETDNNKSIMDLYQEALDDLKKRYDIKFTEIQEEMEVLRKRLEDEQTKYTSLKKAFDTYKKNNK